MSGRLGRSTAPRDLFEGLVIDNFAGGGGASVGIEQALGRPVDFAINHDAEAVGMHLANHPNTQHLREDVWQVDPREVTRGQPVRLAWFSPDCKHHSKAKGGKPREGKIRGLAWVALRWAAMVRPDVIMLENVEEFAQWGPLTRGRKPCRLRKGATFERWKQQLSDLGYQIEHRELRACDFGAPTIRKRLFVVARCDGEAIVWPHATHGPGLQPYRTAAECIDWEILCPSIFERSKPLADATLRRIAHGIKRYVIEAATPFIVPITHRGGLRVNSAEEPLRTITTAHRGEFAVCAPTLIQTGYGEREGQAPRVPGLDKPLGTIVAGGQKHALVAAFLAKHYSGVVGSDMRAPIGTITSVDHHSGVAAHMVIQRGTSNSAAANAPLHTISAGGGHHAEVRALLIKYYGTDQDPQLLEPLHTVTTKHRFGLVTVQGGEYVIADIGLRMLQPLELYRAQGFPSDYITDRDATGKPLTKTAQVRLCGNSVCPPVAAALVHANLVDVDRRKQAA